MYIVLLFIECMVLPTLRNQFTLICPIFIASWCRFHISEGYDKIFIIKIMLKNRKSLNW
jgi:hypothetical protein